MHPPPLLKLIVVGACVSVLAALFLAATPTLQPDIVLFPQRVALFFLRYTMPLSLLMVGVFLILCFIGSR